MGMIMKHIKKTFGIISLLLIALMLFSSCTPADVPLSGTSDIGISGTKTEEHDNSDGMTDAERAALNADSFALEGEWETLAQTAFEVKLINRESEGRAVARVAAVRTSEGQHLIYIDIIDNDGKVISSAKQYGRGFVFAVGEEPEAISVLTTNVMKEKSGLVCQLMYYSFGDAVVSRDSNKGEMHITEDEAVPAGIAVRRIKCHNRIGGAWAAYNRNYVFRDPSSVAFSLESFSLYNYDLHEVFTWEENNGKTYFYTVLDSHTEKDAVMTASPCDKITALEPKDENGVSNSKIFSYHPLKMIEELYEKYLNGWF